jgi:hypothetical protein
MRSRRPSSFVFDGVLSVLFLLLLVLPVCLAVIPNAVAPGGLEENRRLAEVPKFPMTSDALKTFPRKFEAYYNDHFRLRDAFIRGHNRLKIKLLKESPQRDVLMGRDGWLFFRRNNLLEDFFALEPFTEGDLSGLQHLLEAKRDWLSSQGIPYFLVVAPNKQSIYPEQMPQTYYRSRGPSRLDQLLDHMRTQSDVNMVDLREDLLAGKTSEQVYFRTDTHWNEIGAFIAYRSIMDAIRRATNDDRLVPHSLKDYQRVESIRKGGDLTKMLGFTDETQERYDRLEPLFLRCAQKKELPDYMGRAWKPFPEPVAFTCSTARLDLVMLHDSFGRWLRPYMAENFRKSVFVWQHQLPMDVFKKIVMQEKPDVVVEEIVERMVYYLKDELKN